jgi:hypothetical protein
MNTYWLTGTRSGSIASIPQMNHLIDPGYRDARRLSEPFYKSSDATRLSFLNENLQRKRNSEVKFQEFQNELSSAQTASGSHKYALKPVDEVERKLSVADSGISMDKSSLEDKVDFTALPYDYLSNMNKSERNNSPLLATDDKFTFHRNSKSILEASDQAMNSNGDSNSETFSDDSHVTEETDQVNTFKPVSVEKERHKLSIQLDNISEHSENTSIIEEIERPSENGRRNRNQVSNILESVRL